MNRNYWELAEELTVEMIPEGLKDIGIAIGPLNLVKVLDVINGNTIYLPKPESLLTSLRDQQIKSEFNGYNFDELARKYELSGRYIQKVCKSK